MSPRTAAEVERSLEQHRSELAAALVELRSEARQVADVRAHVARYRARAEELADQNAGELLAAAGGVGFVVVGGAVGLARLPFKLAGAALGRPGGRTRLEVARMRQDRHSRQLGRALAAVAAADGQIRSPRRGFRGGLLVRTVRRAIVLGPPIGAGVALLLSEDDWRVALEKWGDQLLDRLLAD